MPSFVRLPSQCRPNTRGLLQSLHIDAAEGSKARKEIALAETVLDVLLEDRPADVKRAYTDLVKRGAGSMRPLRAGVKAMDPKVRERLDAVA